MGANYSFYVKTIETHARAFFKVIIFSIGSVFSHLKIYNFDEVKTSLIWDIYHGSLYSYLPKIDVYQTPIVQRGCSESCRMSFAPGLGFLMVK